PPASAAAAVAAFLRVTEADFAERKRLAQFLISYLSEGASAMPESVSPSVLFGASGSSGASEAPGVPLAIRSAAASAIGRVRARHEDAGYAGPGLIAGADGFGPGGDRASAAAIDALRRLESAHHPESAPPAPGSAAGAVGQVAGSAETSDVVPADLLNVLSDAVAAAGAA